MKSLEKDGYIYSPPAWRVCGECGGRGWTLSANQGEGFPKLECSVCNGTGRIPLYYTPEQWQEAGGVLHDDTPVWVYEVNKYRWTPWTLDEHKYVSQMGLRIIIATEAGRPPEDWRGE
jgi:hypothetical protein